MPRYILIDNATGYIFGDTADMPQHDLHDEVRNGSHSDDTMIAAARWLDEAEVGEYGRSYEVVPSLASNETGYLVYRTTLKDLAIVTDGQDQEMIDAVTEHCRHVGTVRCVTATA